MMPKKKIQHPPDEATEPRAAAEKVPVMHYGRFKGVPLAKLSKKYLAQIYAAFAKGRKPIEKELRSRGCDDEDLEYFKKNYRYLGKSPKKQSPEEERPNKKTLKTAPSQKAPDGKPPKQKNVQANPVLQSATQYMKSGAKRGRRRRKPRNSEQLSAEDSLREKRAEALARATTEKMLAEKKSRMMSLQDHVRQRRRK